MALPGSGPISIGMVAGELGIGLPLSLGDSRVRALAGTVSGPISLGQLRGKSAYTPMAVSTVGASSGPVASDNSAGTVIGTATSRVSGGVGPFTYSWAILQNTNAVQVGPTNGPELSGSKSFTRQSSGSASVVARLTVTDSTARSVTSVETYIDLYWGTYV